MENIMIMTSTLQFRNPEIGKPTRAVKEHYNGRRIEAMINGKEELFRFTEDELDFNVGEDEMIEAIKEKLSK